MVDQNTTSPVSGPTLRRQTDGAPPYPLRYYNLSSYLRKRFGGPVGKIPLDAGLSCPNRDGRLSRHGCIFCNEQGSGTGAAGRGLSIDEQLENFLRKSAASGRKYIAYFQSYTNTYAPADQLNRMWRSAIRPEQVVGLSVGTRPDCLSQEVIEILADLALEKEVWLELGLQSANDATLQAINRGHTVDDYRRAVEILRPYPLKLIAHVIIGLPGESETDVLRCARFISELNMDGVKIHSLYISSGTQLARWYEDGRYEPLTQKEFVRLTALFLENISSEMVIHRLTGDPAPETLIAPDWALDKNETIDLIRKRLETLNTWQGRCFQAGVVV